MAGEGDFEKSDGDVLYASEIRKLYGLGVTTTIGTTAEGTFPKVDGDPPYASEINNFEHVRWSDLIYNGATGGTEIVGILAHSSTVWTAYVGGDTVITVSAGVSWTAANADNAALTGVGKVCDADGTNAIVCDHNSNATFLSVDSGDNWVAANTDPAAITRVYDISYPTTSVAVLAVDIGAANKGIFIGDPSSGAGSLDWAECSSVGPAVDVVCVDMVDGSDGICIDGGNNIWTTLDGGDNWTDSGEDTVGIAVPASMIALTTTTGVLLSSSVDAVQTFDTTNGGVTARLSIPDASEAQCHLSNLCRITNGNLYFIQFLFSDAADRSLNMTLYKSEDDGVTWKMRALGNCIFSTTGMEVFQSKAEVLEYDTDKLLILAGGFTLMKIDES